MAEKLFREGAFLEIYDPKVSKESINKDINYYWSSRPDFSQDRIRVKSEAPNFKEIDVTAILTEWDEFKNLVFENSSVFDGRNLLQKTDYSIGK